MKKTLILTNIILGILLFLSCASQKTQTIASKSNQEPEMSDSDEIFLQVDIPPVFSGGNPMKWVSSQLKYPAEALETGAEGKVYIDFIVEKDGSISNLFVIRSSGNQYLDREGMRLVRMLTKWEPGIKNNKKVRTRRSFPINFSLSY